MNSFPQLAALAAELTVNPWKGQLLQQLKPQEYDQVIKLAESPFFRFVPFRTKTNSCQVGWLASKAKNKWAICGNRTGKTLSGLYEDLADCLLLDPLTRKPSTRFNEPVRCWVISASEKTSIDIAEATLVRDLLGENQSGFLWNLVKDNCHYSKKSGFDDHYVELVNGSWIRFKYCTQELATFSGERLHKAHMDEKNPREYYSEVRARLVDLDGYFAGTWTPVYDKREGIPWIYEELYLDREKKGIEFHNWSLYDNPHLAESAKKQLVQEWDEDEIEARVYGQFVPIGVKLAFSTQLQRALKPSLRDPIARGDLELTEDGQTIRFLDNPQGWLKIWEHPQPGEVYAVGGDSAEGLARGDDSVFEVFKLSTGEQVAEVQGKIDPVSFGELGYLLGTYYHQALIGIENTKDLTPLNVLFQAGYRNLYFQMDAQGKPYEKATGKLGFNTNLRSRTRLVAQGRDWLKDGSILIRSHSLMAQMEAFALHLGKFQALPGAHDDLVMAFLIAVEMLRVAGAIESSRNNSLPPLVNGMPLTEDPEVYTDEEYKRKVLEENVLLKAGKYSQPETVTFAELV